MISICTAQPNTWVIYCQRRKEKIDYIWLEEVLFWSAVKNGKDVEYSPVTFNGDYLDDSYFEDYTIVGIEIGIEKAKEKLRVFAENHKLIPDEDFMYAGTDPPAKPEPPR